MWLEVSWFQTKIQNDQISEDFRGSMMHDKFAVFEQNSDFSRASFHNSPFQILLLPVPKRIVRIKAVIVSVGRKAL